MWREVAARPYPHVGAPEALDDPLVVGLRLALDVVGQRVLDLVGAHPLAGDQQHVAGVVGEARMVEVLGAVRFGMALDAAVAALLVGVADLELLAVGDERRVLGIDDAGVAQAAHPQPLPAVGVGGEDAGEVFAGLREDEPLETLAVGEDAALAGLAGRHLRHRAPRVGAREEPDLDLGVGRHRRGEGDGPVVEIADRVGLALEGGGRHGHALGDPEAVGAAAGVAVAPGVFDPALGDHGVGAVAGRLPVGEGGALGGRPPGALEGGEGGAAEVGGLAVRPGDPDGQFTRRHLPRHDAIEVDGVDDELGLQVVGADRQHHQILQDVALGQGVEMGVLVGDHAEGAVRRIALQEAPVQPGADGAGIDKPAAAMAAVFGSEIKRLFVTKPGPFKESDPAAIAQAFERHGFAVQLVVDTAEAIRQAAAAARKSHLPLLVCGSFYLCAEVAAELTG